MEIDADFWPGQRLIKKTVWTMFRLKVWKYYEWFSEVLWLPRESFIVWFTESVDRQEYFVPSIVSLGDFVLKPILC